MAYSKEKLENFDELQLLPEELENQLVTERQEAFRNLTGQDLITEIGRINSKYRAMKTDIEYVKPIGKDTTLEQYLDRIHKPSNSNKFKRHLDVASIIVTTSKGYKLDGDELSQSRMHKRITIYDDSKQLDWIDADNNIITITIGDLREALELAIDKQNSLWTS